MRLKATLFFLIVALFALAASAQTTGTAPNDIAHGSEKVAHEATHPTENHGEGHEAPKTYFGIPGWILKLINMLAFIGILVYLMKPPLAKVFAERRAAIQAGLLEATERRAKADRLAQDIQARLDQIDGEVSAIMERAREEGARQKAELIAAAETEAQKILAASRSEAETRLKAAREELMTYARHLSTERAEELLRTNVTDADRKRLFEQSVQDMGQVQS